MNFVGGGLKLKGKAVAKSAVSKPGPTTQLLDKRPKGDEVDDSDPKPEKKVKAVATKPPGTEGETVEKVEAKEADYKKVLESNWKTDYEKRVAIQRQQKLKSKIEEKLKKSHRYFVCEITC